jgi:hypothetical protein
MLSDLVFCLRRHNHRRICILCACAQGRTCHNRSLSLFKKSKLCWMGIHWRFNSYRVVQISLERHFPIVFCLNFGLSSLDYFT